MAKKTLSQTTFQQEVPTFCFRTFIAAGRKFQRGSLFPWKDLKISPEKAAQLHKTGHIRHIDVSKPEPTLNAVDVSHTEAYKSGQVVEEASAEEISEAMTLKQLRDIADDVGAPYKKTKAEQIAAIEAAEKDAG